MINTAGYKICDIEKENDELALEIAAEGIVLLENSGALPLKSKNVALYGSGARNTCKGGTGSGEVNNRRKHQCGRGVGALRLPCDHQGLAGRLRFTDGA